MQGGAISRRVVRAVMHRECDVEACVHRDDQAKFEGTRPKGCRAWGVLQRQLDSNTLFLSCKVANDRKSAGAGEAVGGQLAVDGVIAKPRPTNWDSTADRTAGVERTSLT